MQILTDSYIIDVMNQIVNNQGKGFVLEKAVPIKPLNVHNIILKIKIK